MAAFARSRAKARGWMTHGKDAATDELDGAAKARLRGADVATGIVLALVALLMIAEALTYPLEGTYAGVRNAWYVSPALFPLIVGGALLVLSLGLVAVAARDRARLKAQGTHVARPRSGRAMGRDAWFIAVLLAAYIVGLVPRIDFASATALFLFAFMAGYIVEARLRVAVASCLVLPSLLALAIALAGAWPPPRSGGQLVLDGIVAGMFVVTCLIALFMTKMDLRRRLRTAAGTSLAAAILLSAVFRYGLLVPLPREGLVAILMEGVAGELSRLVG